MSVDFAPRIYVGSTAIGLFAICTAFLTPSAAVRPQSLVASPEPIQARVQVPALARAGENPAVTQVARSVGLEPLNLVDVPSLERALISPQSAEVITEWTQLDPGGSRSYGAALPPCTDCVGSMPSGMDGFGTLAAGRRFSSGGGGGGGGGGWGGGGGMGRGRGLGSLGTRARAGSFDFGDLASRATRMRALFGEGLGDLPVQPLVAGFAAPPVTAAAVDVPEPSSLLLAAFALSGVLAASRRFRPVA